MNYQIFEHQIDITHMQNKNYLKIKKQKFIVLYTDYDLE